MTDNGNSHAETPEQQETTVSPQIREISNFVAGLAAESERSAVVLGAARLDLALENLLKASMQHHPGGSDNLFDPDRPIGSFSAKIALAYRLGIIDGQIEHALQMVRRIRNDFAHSIENATLADSRHRDRIRELVRDAKDDSMWEVSRSWMKNQAAAERLADFCAAIAILIVILEASDRSVLMVHYTLGFD